MPTEERVAKFGRPTLIEQFDSLHAPGRAALHRQERHGMNLAENRERDFPQVVGENFTNEAKERWATDFKILLQRRDVTMPRERELVGQVDAIKRRVLPSGKVSFDAERNARGHADEFWAVALACQRERQADKPKAGEIGVRVLG